MRFASRGKSEGFVRVVVADVDAVADSEDLVGIILALLLDLESL